MLNASGQSVTVKLNAPAEIDSAATLDIEAHAERGPVAVDIFWNEQKLATLTSPPYRYELRLPQPKAFGYVRAVARDASGATAEDARLVNAVAVAEEVNVDVVEVYAITRERGLTASDFVVKEDGLPVEVELRSTPEDPVAIGIAVDASASMRGLMIDVMQAGNEFVNRALRAGDQAFVVAFDDQPTVVQPLTSDLSAVRAAVTAVGATGNTAVWDSVVYSLQQFRAVAGKRALIVFTDGGDNGSRATHETVIATARQIGVPIYIFYFEPPPAAPLPDVRLRSRLPPAIAASPEWRLREITKETGGTLFRSPRKADLPRLFEQIRDDTRSEYILTFTSRSKKPRNALRKISVALPRHGEVRAMTAYYPR
jgi:VWFA-related protein